MIHIREIHHDATGEVVGFTGMVEYPHRAMGFGAETRTRRHDGRVDYVRHEFCMGRIKLTLKCGRRTVQVMLDPSSNEVAQLEIGYPMWPPPERPPASRLKAA